MGSGADHTEKVHAGSKDAQVGWYCEPRGRKACAVLGSQQVGPTLALP